MCEPNGCIWDVSTTTVLDTFSLAPTRSTVSVAATGGSVSPTASVVVVLEKQHLSFNDASTIVHLLA